MKLSHIFLLFLIISTPVLAKERFYVYYEMTQAESQSIHDTSYIFTSEDKAEIKLLRGIKQIVISKLEQEGYQVTQDEKHSQAQVLIQKIELGKAVSVILKKKRNGKIEYVAKKNIDRIENLDRDVSLLMQKLFSEPGDPEAEQVGSISKQNTDKLIPRIRTRKFSGFLFGPAWIIGERGAFYNVTLGKFRDVNEQAIVKYVMSGTFSPDTYTNYLYSGLGLNYLFSRNNVSPFIGADFNIAAHFNRDNTKNWIYGFGLTLNGGLHAFRIADTQVVLEAKTSMFFHSREDGFPVQLGINFGVLY